MRKGKGEGGEDANGVWAVLVLAPEVLNDDLVKGGGTYDRGEVAMVL